MEFLTKKKKIIAETVGEDTCQHIEIMEHSNSELPQIF